MTPALAAAKCVAALESNPDMRRATVFLSEKFTVKVTRQRPHRRRARYEGFVLSCGAPNYAERQFLRACRKAGEPLPVRRVQLRAWPRKRSA